MTPVQMLADSARPLTEVLVDRLRAAGRPSPLDHLRRRHDHDDDADGAYGVSGDAAQAELALYDDEVRTKYDAPTPHPLRPDEAAAAIVLGRGLDQNREALRRLQDPATTAVIHIPHPDLVDLVERILRDFVFGRDVNIVDGEHGKPGDGIAQSGSVVLFCGEDQSNQKILAKRNAAFGAAVQRRCAIVGVAADPDRMLPPDLLRLADQRIELPSLDADAVAAVIEAITGTRPTTVDEELARAVTLGTLVASVRADLGAKGSLARLRRLVARDPNASSEPRLADLHGLGAARAWGEALVADLRDYKEGRIPLAAINKGLLLTGAPGTGKTTLVAAIAREAEVFFVATSYSDFSNYKEGHLSHVLQRIRQKFAEARQHRPSILFIDEIDTIPARGGGSKNQDWWNSILSSLLTEIDGINGDGNERNQGVVVIGACNGDPSQIDAALLRSGRLDRHIEIPLPDVPALIGIFRLHLGGDLADVDLRPAAVAARSRTGADVERFVREARRVALKQARALVLQDLLNAIGAGQRQTSPELRRRVSYHEAGHALVTLLLGLAKPVAISIEGDGGFSENEITATRALTRAHCEEILTVLLAGRAAEILVFGEPTAGAGGAENSDLDRATQLALRLETSYGLGQLGPVSVGRALTPRDLLIMPDLHRAVRRTLEAVEAKAVAVLTANRCSLDALAETLFRSGYLDRSEIDAVLATVPLRPSAPDPGLSPSPAVVPQAGRSKHAEDGGNGPRQGLSPDAGSAP